MRISDWSSDVCSSDLSPHQLRHTFAVHMLALLIQQRLREAALPAGPVESYRLILGDPLQQVQRLLCHASLATTYIYLDHIATRADTVDAAVEELMVLLPGPQGARASVPARAGLSPSRTSRSEEHTSELKSLMRHSYDGCGL